MAMITINVTKLLANLPAGIRSIEFYEHVSLQFDAKGDARFLPVRPDTRPPAGMTIMPPPLPATIRRRKDIPMLGTDDPTVFPVFDPRLADNALAYITTFQPHPLVKAQLAARGIPCIHLWKGPRSEIQSEVSASPVVTGFAPPAGN